MIIAFHLQLQNRIRRSSEKDIFVVLSENKDNNADTTSSLSNYAFRPYADFSLKISDCQFISQPNWHHEENLSWVEERF